MNRCLRERALLSVFAGEGTAAQHTHLRLCADCAERYDGLIDDLEAIGDGLRHTPPAARALSDVPGAFLRGLPFAAAAGVLLVVGLTVTQLLAPTPAPVASRSANVPAFAADVSAALFASGDDSNTVQIASDAPYLQAALEAGLPCTQDDFFNGECDDQVAAIAFESD
jgi:hypothetical protein